MTCMYPPPHIPSGRTPDTDDNCSVCMVPPHHFLLASAGRRVVAAERDRDGEGEGEGEGEGKG